MNSVQDLPPMMSHRMGVLNTFMNSKFVCPSTISLDSYSIITNYKIKLSVVLRVYLSVQEEKRI